MMAAYLYSGGGIVQADEHIRRPHVARPASGSRDSQHLANTLGNK